MKYFYVYICVVIFIISLLIYIIGGQYFTSEAINKRLDEESKKRIEIITEIELLKSNKKELDLSIEEIKKYVEGKEKVLLNSIQAIKNKGNVQVRNVTDSSFSSILKELQPK